MQIDTSSDAKENKDGQYYVWLTLYSGEIFPIHKGTLDSCKQEYKALSHLLDNI